MDDRESGTVTKDIEKIDSYVILSISRNALTAY